MNRLLLDWQGKLLCLFLAVLVWLAVKAKQEPDFDEQVADFVTHDDEEENKR